MIGELLFCYFFVLIVKMVKVFGNVIRIFLTKFEVLNSLGGDNDVRHKKSYNQESNSAPNVFVELNSIWIASLFRPILSYRIFLNYTVSFNNMRSLLRIIVQWMLHMIGLNMGRCAPKWFLENNFGNSWITTLGKIRRHAQINQKHLSKLKSTCSLCSSIQPANRPFKPHYRYAMFILPKHISTFWSEILYVLNDFTLNCSHGLYFQCAKCASNLDSFVAVVVVSF